MKEALVYNNPWNDKDVEVFWDNVACLYCKENNKVKQVHDQRFLISLQHLKLTEGQKILNISSRDAGADPFLRNACPGISITHAEISKNLMDVASSLRPGIHQVKLTTYSALPFPDGYFDRVLSLETLEHVQNPFLFLKELHRVSKPAARFVLSCPPASSEWTYNIYTTLFGGHGEGPHKFPSSWHVKKILEKSGWHLLLHRGTVLFPVGPRWFFNAGEWLIARYQNTWFSELGIRQFYVCEKY